MTSRVIQLKPQVVFIRQFRVNQKPGGKRMVQLTSSALLSSEILRVTLSSNRYRVETKLEISPSVQNNVAVKMKFDQRFNVTSERQDNGHAQGCSSRGRERPWFLLQLVIVEWGSGTAARTAPSWEQNVSEKSKRAPAKHVEVEKEGGKGQKKGRRRRRRRKSRSWSRRRSRSRSSMWIKYVTCVSSCRREQSKWTARGGRHTFLWLARHYVGRLEKIICFPLDSHTFQKNTFLWLARHYVSRLEKNKNKNWRQSWPLDCKTLWAKKMKNQTINLKIGKSIKMVSWEGVKKLDLEFMKGDSTLNPSFLCSFEHLWHQNVT